MSSGLSLVEEEKCKAIWDPWFKAGSWNVQLFTSGESAEFQIPKVIKNIKDKVQDSEALKEIESELLKYAKSLKFPHDGEASRGKFMFCFDFKFKRSTPHGIFVKKAVYDKYWSWHKPYFYLLIWANDKQKRYIHQIREPSKYRVIWLPSAKPYVDEEAYYDITEDCEEIKIPDAPIKFPKPTEDLSVVESYAIIFAANRWADNNFKGEFQINADDMQRARELLNKSNREILILLLRDTKILKPISVKKLRKRIKRLKRKREHAKP